MKITDAEVIVCSPGRNFVTLRIETDEGLYGLGDATLNGREKAVVAYLEEHLLPCLSGRDPFDIEDIWQYGYKGAYWRRGPVTMTAIGAVDMALWDLKGKALGVPVYQLLGGRSRDKLLVYTHAQGRDAEETLDQIARKVEQGYRAVRVQSGVPGMKKIYGVADPSADYEPAVKGTRPQEEQWSTTKYLNFIPQLFAQVRERFGDDLHLLHDAHHRLTPIEAARLGKELEPFHLFWLEDAVPAELQESFRLIRRHTTTPLAVGEVFNTVYDAQDLITQQLIDYIRMTASHGGGLTPLKKIAALAELYHVRTACHGASDLSPVNLAVCLQLGMAVNNFGIQEYMGYPAETAEIFRFAHTLTEGHFSVNDTPGLGVDIDEGAAKKYPYQPAYLPVNRLEDGTMFDW